MKKTVIRVGHGAYKGSNALRMCFSKEQAVRVLRTRGVTRDTARKAVDAALAIGGASITTPDGYIELCDYAWAISDDYAACKSTWANAPEC